MDLAIEMGLSSRGMPLATLVEMGLCLRRSQGWSPKGECAKLAYGLRGFVPKEARRGLRPSWRCGILCNQLADIKMSTQDAPQPPATPDSIGACERRAERQPRTRAPNDT